MKTVIFFKNGKMVKQFTATKVTKELIEKELENIILDSMVIVEEKNIHSKRVYSRRNNGEIIRVDDRTDYNPMYFLPEIEYVKRELF